MKNAANAAVALVAIVFAAPIALGFAHTAFEPTHAHSAFASRHETSSATTLARARIAFGAEERARAAGFDRAFSFAKPFGTTRDFTFGAADRGFGFEFPIDDIASASADPSPAHAFAHVAGFGEFQFGAVG
jgi:hypothetical protein